MENYFNVFVNAYKNYASYLWNDITNPSWRSYFYWLILVSLIFFLLEILQPWRRAQKVLRKDFFLDLFYMFFNFFLFSLIIYNAASDVVVHAFNDGIKYITGGFDLQASNPLRELPLWAILVIGFVVRDFVQWWIHRLLHRFEFLWKFHQVHHSVEEMGFAAHLRFHWMENVVYRSIEYLPLALLGIGLHDFFLIHIFTLVWGHYNHANISFPKWLIGGLLGAFVGMLIVLGAVDIHFAVDYQLLIKVMIVGASILIGALVLGPVVHIVFNSPEMHIWHHAHDLPETHKYGVNFGLTLGIWDYIFKTNYIPYNGRDIPLGFEELEEFPKDFVGQSVYGIK